jgi:hypothetical protein
MTTATFAVATPHALILTVSHGLLFQPIPLPAAARMPPSQFFAFQFTVCACLARLLRANPSGAPPAAMPTPLSASAVVTSS